VSTVTSPLTEPTTTSLSLEAFVEENDRTSPSPFHRKQSRNFRWWLPATLPSLVARQEESSMPLQSREPTMYAVQLSIFTGPVASRGAMSLLRPSQIKD